MAHSLVSKMNRRMGRAVRVLFPTLAVAFFLGVVAVRAEELPTPAVVDELSLEAGYRWVNADGGGETLRPYGDLGPSAVAALRLLREVPWLGFVDLRAEFFGQDNFLLRGELQRGGDLDVSLNLLRYTRNAEHGLLPPSMAPNPEINFEDTDPGRDYQRTIADGEVALRYRIPGYPAHVTLDARRFSRKGNVQQVFAEESCTRNCHVVSSTRRVDTVTNSVGLSADAHLGYVDVAYSFRNHTFRDNEPDPTWEYGPLFGYRQPGELERNVWPGISSRDHSLSVSTIATSRVVASLGFHSGRRENEETGLVRQYDTRGANVVLRPHPAVSVALRWRRQEKDEDVPAAVAALRLEAEEPVSYAAVEDLRSAILSVLPMKGLKLQGTWSRRALEREEAEARDLPPEMVTTTWRLQARATPVRGVAVDLSHQERMIDDPDYATTPTDRIDDTVSLSAQPLPWMLVTASWQGTRAENNETVPAFGVEGQAIDREETRRTLQGGITLAPVNSFSLGFQYVRFTESISQDLILANDGPILFQEDGAPYEGRGDQVSIQAAWRPAKTASITAGVARLTAGGSYRVEVEPFAEVDGYSGFDAVQWRYDLGGDVELGGGWSVGLRGLYADYEDRNDRSRDEILREVVLTARLRW